MGIGCDPKKYRRRARSLLFNLGAANGVLLRRILEGGLSPAGLVRLGAEDLASDALKAERQEERAKYFRSEVHIEHGPPKRRRDLLNAQRGYLFQQISDGPREEKPQCISTPLSPAPPLQSGNAMLSYGSNIAPTPTLH